MLLPPFKPHMLLLVPVLGLPVLLRKAVAAAFKTVAGRVFMMMMELLQYDG
jgi:hypothetical protein